MNRNGDNQTLILVDEDDNPVGFETKLRAHQNGGKLHRAFSVFIFDSAGRALLQRRAQSKYHFGGLWTNACCSHPTRDEIVHLAARRRLQQEMGFDAEVTKAFSFVYRAYDPMSDLTEHEFDHVFLATFNGAPQPNPDEVDDWKWVSLPEVMEELKSHPYRYTPWFKIAVDRLIEVLPSVCSCATPTEVIFTRGRLP